MRFILHVGAGKTGTSTIQSYLQKNRQKLMKDGVLYAGMRFEFDIRKRNWQKLPWGFRKLSNEELTKEFIELFDHYLSVAKKKKCHTIVLSNESISNFIPRFIPFLQHASRNSSLSIALYVREPESWIVSAYQQWGIKMGAMTKKLLSFSDYKNEKKVPFLSTIESLQGNGFEDALHVRNMSACDDVLHDFLGYFDLPQYGLHDRVNERRSDLEQMLFYLVNENAHGRGRDRKKQKLIRELVGDIVPMKYKEFVEKTYPSVSDFKDASEYESIRVALNNYLPEGQKFSEDSAVKIKPPKPLLSEDNFFDLVKICVSLGERVEELEKSIEERNSETQSLRN